MEDRLDTIPEASSDIKFQLTNGSQSVPLYWGQKMPRPVCGVQCTSFQYSRLSNHAKMKKTTKNSSTYVPIRCRSALNGSAVYARKLTKS
ncbi:MAG: hypothetical protein CM15mP74_01150 [Halieaceae bacterium]|nr:MAG: hypothetical protein CM15mP74_01150 [Halieaceae bacterium]